MNFSKKDVAIGFIIIAVAIGGAYLFKKWRTPKVSVTPTPVSIGFQKELEDKFRIDIPDTENNTELKDVAGKNSRGIATDKEILADIEDPASGYFYQGWLEKNDLLVSLGKLQIAKGGWLLEFNKSKLPDAEKIIVSLENKFDDRIEKRILEGSFN